MHRGLRVAVVALLVLGGCTNHAVTAPRDATPSAVSPSPSFSLSPSPRTHPAPPPNLRAAYRGWRVYWSWWERASFSYPRGWKVATDVPWPDGDMVTLTAPDGFTVHWISPLAGIGGGCDEARSAHIYIVKILSMPPIRSLHRLYIVLISVRRHKSLAIVDARQSRVRIGDVGYCLYYPAFSSKTHTKFDSIVQFFTGCYVQLRDGDYCTTSNTTNRLTESQYLSLPDVQTVLKVFRSLRY